MTRRNYIAPPDSERCEYQATTTLGGEGSRCMRRAVFSDLCRQHYAKVDDQTRAMMGNGASYAGIRYWRSK